MMSSTHHIQSKENSSHSQAADAVKQRLLSKIRFLQDQIESLDGYLPETYEFLMAQLDQQQCLLYQLEVKEEFQRIDEDHDDN
jgi:hypothetical protein